MHRGVLSVIIFAVIVAAVLAHTFFYFSDFGKVAGYDGGISGLALKEIDGESESGFRLGDYIIFAEWAVVAGIFLFFSMKRRMGVKGEVAEVLAQKNAIVVGGTNTDIDKLYVLVQQRKKVGISAVAAAFNISRDLALTWGAALESAGLAIVEYPHIGEPQIIINEENEKQKEE